MRTPPKLHVVDLFPHTSSRLIDLLNGLSLHEWNPSTICPLWSVKDIAANLLGGNISRLARRRGGYSNPQSKGTSKAYSDILQEVDKSNAEWVRAMARVSPKILIQLIESTDRELYELFRTLDPDQPSISPVSWAGHIESPNWFDIAREYTEKWVHQRQIRDVVKKPGLTERKYFYS